MILTECGMVFRQRTMQSVSIWLVSEVSEGNKDDEVDDTSNAAGSQDEPCTIPYCNCPCHKKKGSAPPAPPPAPPAMGGYCGEGSTQFATWGYGY